MRFGLLGDHADGLAMARALVASGRHALAIYAGPAAALEVLARDGIQAPRGADLEEALATVGLEAVIVASSPGRRAVHVRRALQSELHVLCVHPVDPSADFAYEAALLQSDVRRVLLPLLPETLHPGIRRLAASALRLRKRADPGSQAPAPPATPLQLIEIERWYPEEFLLDTGKDAHKPALPGWDVLRLLGGDIAEVSALAHEEELARGVPLLLTGRFVQGGLWKITLMPNQQQPMWRLAVVSAQARTELLFPQGWPGPCELRGDDEIGQAPGERWDSSHPWAALVEVFDAAVADWQTRQAPSAPGATDTVCLTADPPRLGWLDEIRALELDDAARRSAKRRRPADLDFQDATEEASFKGAMTLVGCGLLWSILLLAILSIWIPWLGWLILPILGIFLAMQALRAIVPGSAEKTDKN